jgi:tetratricopeptide (TPR) repeat protein
MLQKRFAEAADAYARARTIDPTNSAGALFGEAESRLALGEPKDATALYRAYLNAANGRTAAFDEIAEARLQRLVSAVPDPSAALPGQLLWGTGGAALGSAVGVATFTIVLWDCHSFQCVFPALFVALPIATTSFLGGIAYGVRYAGRKHGIHGSLWRGMAGTLLGGLVGGVATAAVGVAIGRDDYDAIGFLLVPLGAVFGAAYANNQMLVTPTADRAELLPAPSKRVPSVLVLPAR